MESIGPAAVHLPGLPAASGAGTLRTPYRKSAGESRCFKKESARRSRAIYLRIPLLPDLRGLWRVWFFRFNFWSRAGEEKDGHLIHGIARVFYWSHSSGNDQMPSGVLQLSYAPGKWAALRRALPAFLAEISVGRVRPQRLFASRPWIFPNAVQPISRTDECPFHSRWLDTWPDQLGFASEQQVQIYSKQLASPFS